MNIAAAVPDIPVPRTLQELKTVVDILDKQDRQAPGAGNFIRHATNLQRSAPIDVEPEPEVDGFRI